MITTDLTYERVAGIQYRASLLHPDDCDVALHLGVIGSAPLTPDTYTETLTTWLFDVEADEVQHVVIQVSDGIEAIARTMNVNGNQESGEGEDEGTQCCPVGYYRSVDAGQCISVVGPPGTPSVPSAPTLEKDCEGQTIIVSAIGIPARTTILELRRQKVGDVSWETVHTWEIALGTTTAPEWADEGTQPLGNYNYQLRAGNATGFSAWSASASLALVSSTLTIALVEPSPIPASVTGEIWIAFSLLDGSPEPVEELDLVITLGGIAVPVVPVLSPTNPCAEAEIQARNGIYRFRLNSRLYRQGVQDLTITARGGDGCLKRLTQALTLANDISSAVFYKDFDYPYSPLPGYKWSGAHLSCESRSLSPVMREQYHIQSRVSAAPSVAAGAEGWPDMEPVQLQEAQSYPESGPFPTGRPLSTQLRGSREKLDVAGNHVLWRTQWTPVETVSWYTTGYKEIVKIRPLAASGDDAQKFVLLCRDADGARAGVLLFDGSDAPYKVTTLVAREDGDFLDACVVGDQIYVLPDATRIMVYDRDAGQFKVELRIPEETRPLRFLENVGGAPFVFAVDAGAILKTSIRDLTFTTRTPVYEGPLEMTAYGEGFENEGGISSVLAFGNQLWTLPGSAAPTLSFTFPSPLAFATPNIVGLENGTIWSLLEDEWVQVVEDGTQYASAALFRGAGGTLRGVAGGDSLQLAEQSQEGDAWFAGQPLEVSGTVVGSEETAEVTALARWLKPVPEAQGDQEPVAPDALLVGTRSGGLLGVWEQTDAATVQGAVIASKLHLPTIDPVMKARSDD